MTIFVICVTYEIHQMPIYSVFTQSGLSNLVIPSELISLIHTPFSFDDFPSFINSEIRRGDELKKHNLIYNGVTQLFIKLCFEIFDLR